MQQRIFEILSNPEVYIGKLDSDDYETADFNLVMGANAPSQVPLPLKVEYRDSNGRLYSKDAPLSLRLFQELN